MDDIVVDSPLEIWQGHARHMYLVDVTPELARLWLATWKGTSRNIVPKHYVQRMRDGTWKFTDNPILFVRGRLCSSRRRLSAIIEANVTLPIYVTDGGVRPPGIIRAD